MGSVVTAALQRDEYRAVLAALLILVPGCILVVLGGDRTLVIGIAGVTAMGMMLDRDARLLILLVIIPFGYFQFAKGYGLYLVYDAFFILLFLGRLLLVDLLQWRKAPVLGWLFLMAAAFLPSLLNSPKLSASGTAYIRFFMGALTAWGVYYYAIRSKRPGFILLAARLFALEAAAVSVVGVYQSYASGSFIKIVTGRVYFSYFGDPNYYAAYLLMAFAIALALFFHDRRWSLRLVDAAAAGALTFAVVSTISRAGLLTLVFLVGAFALYVLVTGRGSHKIAGAAVTILIAGGVGVLLFTNIGSRLVDIVRLSSRVQQAVAGRDASLEQRGKILEVTWRVIEAHPVVGVGFGGFEQSFDAYKLGLLSTGSARSVHNTPLRIVAETGVIGLVPSMGFALSLFLFLWKGTRASDRAGARTFVTGLLMAVVSYFVMSLTLDQLLEYQFWPICGLALAAAETALRDSQPLLGEEGA